MKITELPACPKCGIKPQFNWRNRSAGACHGSLSCHFRHYRVEQAYHAGAQEAARKLLMGKWNKLVKTVKFE